MISQYINTILKLYYTVEKKFLHMPKFLFCMYTVN